MSNKIINEDKMLFTDLCQIIDITKQRVATTVNSGITWMYWNIGNRINTEVLGNQRAEYGKQIVATVSLQLQEKYGSGYEPRTLRRMMQFASTFPDLQIVSTVLT